MVLLFSIPNYFLRQKAEVNLEKPSSAALGLHFVVVVVEHFFFFFEAVVIREAGFLSWH